MNTFIYVIDISLRHYKIWTLETSVESAESVGLTQTYMDLFQPNGFIKFWFRYIIVYLVFLLNNNNYNNITFTNLTKFTV